MTRSCRHIPRRSRAPFHETASYARRVARVSTATLPTACSDVDCRRTPTEADLAHWNLDAESPVVDAGTSRRVGRTRSVIRRLRRLGRGMAVRGSRRYSSGWRCWPRCRSGSFSPSAICSKRAAGWRGAAGFATGSSAFGRRRGSAGSRSRASCCGCRSTACRSWPSRRGSSTRTAGSRGSGSWGFRLSPYVFALHVTGAILRGGAAPRLPPAAQHPVARASRVSRRALQRGPRPALGHRRRRCGCRTTSGSASAGSSGRSSGSSFRWCCSRRDTAYRRSGMLGAVLLAVVVLYVPFLQVRFARDNRLRAFREVGQCAGGVPRRAAGVRDRARGPPSASRCRSTC